MGNLNTNLFNELFIYVPRGESERFKQQYSENNQYKSKITFIEDTHEIFVNGKSFGYNYDEALEEIWNVLRQHTQDFVTVNANINQINTAITNEALVREARDTELSNFINSKVNTEQSRAQLKENALNTSILSLISRIENLERHIY